MQKEISSLVPNLVSNITLLACTSLNKTKKQNKNNLDLEQSTAFRYLL